MNNISNIEKNVMRRVHTIHALRPIISGGALALFLLVVALYGIGREVFVAKVFANGPQDLLGHLQYLAYAFTTTRFVVQLLTLATAVSSVYLAREIARSITALILPPATV